MSTKIFSLALFVSLTSLASCSSGNNAAEAELEIEGSYDLRSISTTPLDINGGTCGEATGTMVIDDKQISGSALSSNGFSLDLQGEITDIGVVTGGFAEGGQVIATFTGNISNTNGSGAWQDNLECTGTWLAERNQN